MLCTLSGVVLSGEVWSEDSVREYWISVIWSGVRCGRLLAVVDNMVSEGIVRGNCALTKSGNCICLTNIMSGELGSGDYVQNDFNVDLTVLSSFLDAIFK